MKIGIHDRQGSYSDRWIQYCIDHGIEYKIVNAYDPDIIGRLKDCDAFMWHHHHYSYKDKCFAKQLLFSLEQSGKIVFPDFNTGWHFDDKLGQKYLFEATQINAAKAWAFYDRKSALEWIRDKASFPLVYKLRSGASASNVFLVKNARQARRLINYAFGRFTYLNNPDFCLRNGRERLVNLLEDIGRRIAPWKSGRRFLPEQKGYVYFQEFIPNNGFDYRLEIVGDKCIALRRYNRKGDFRASGGHDNHYDPELFPRKLFAFGFRVHKQLGLQSSSLDIVQHTDTGEFFLIENSYCYGVDPDEYDHGYWTEDGVHHDVPFNGMDLMIEEVIRMAQSRDSE